MCTPPVRFEDHILGFMNFFCKVMPHSLKETIRAKWVLLEVYHQGSKPYMVLICSSLLKEN
jgi:hypothetical protein